MSTLDFQAASEHSRTWCFNSHKLRLLPIFKLIVVKDGHSSNRASFTKMESSLSVDFLQDVPSASIGSKGSPPATISWTASESRSKIWKSNQMGSNVSSNTMENCLGVAVLFLLGFVYVTLLDSTCFWVPGQQSEDHPIASWPCEVLLSCPLALKANQFYDILVCLKHLL